MTYSEFVHVFFPDSLFAAYYITVKIQKLELQITRFELQKTAEANRATAESNEKNLEVQKHSSLIAGRQAILSILTGPNDTAMKSVFDKDSYRSHWDMINRYSNEIKKSLNALEAMK